MNKLDYNDFAGMFGVWAEIFKPFIESEDMFNIYKKLKEDSQTEIIVPTSDSTFRTFATSDPDKVKVVWYLMDPYPRRYKNRVPQATGIAMDCSNSPDGKLQPSLEKFYDGISRDLKKPITRSLSLEYLQRQGCMMLNTDLTCKLNKTGSHAKLWEPFQKFFLEEIMGGKSGIIYVLAGKESHRMEKFIQPLGNYIYKVEHPAAADHKRTDWEHKNMFSIINKILKDHGKQEIEWNYDKWAQANECPF